SISSIYIYDGEIQKNTFHGNGILYSISTSAYGFSAKQAIQKNDIDLLIKHAKYALEGIWYSNSFVSGRYSKPSNVEYEPKKWRMEWKTIYEGEWEDFFFNGQGTYYFLTGGHFKGNFKNNRPCGKTELHYFNKKQQQSLYINGDWGTSEFIEFSKLIYKDIKEEHHCNNGNFKKEYKTIFNKKNELMYEGEVLLNLPHGMGKLYNPESKKLIYDGEFHSGFFHTKHPKDKSTLYYEDGTILYKGCFKNGKYEGVGQLYYNNQNVHYEGDFLDGQFHGMGKEFSEKGNLVYDGNWEHGKYSGWGKFIASDLITYEIKWDKNKEHLDNLSMYCGKGKRYYPNGNCEIECNFINGKTDGMGKYYYENGKIMYSGPYHRGKPLYNEFYDNQDCIVSQLKTPHPAIINLIKDSSQYIPGRVPNYNFVPSYAGQGSLIGGFKGFGTSGRVSFWS
ncbi:hypothetical protein V7114_27410, partial [Neobacillus niacini]